jgi:hypothetical protein
MTHCCLPTVTVRGNSGSTSQSESALPSVLHKLRYVESLQATQSFLSEIKDTTGRQIWGRRRKNQQPTENQRYNFGLGLRKQMFQRRTKIFW